MDDVGNIVSHPFVGFSAKGYVIVSPPRETRPPWPQGEDTPLSGFIGLECTKIDLELFSVLLGVSILLMVPATTVYKV